MKVMLIFRGNGFEAIRETNIPLILPDMKIAIVLDDGFSVGSEIFPVVDAIYFLEKDLCELYLGRPVKLKSGSTTELNERDFSCGWEIRKNPSLQPFDK